MAFEGCDVVTDRGVTVVRSRVPDQAALQGVIARINALGLELLDVHLVAEPDDRNVTWVTEADRTEEDSEAWPDVPPCWRAVPQPTLTTGGTSGFLDQREFPGGETWG